MADKLRKATDEDDPEMARELKGYSERREVTKSARRAYAKPSPADALAADVAWVRQAYPPADYERLVLDFATLIHNTPAIRKRAIDYERASIEAQAVEKARPAIERETTSAQASRAAKTKNSQPGGYDERRARIVAAWESGKYRTKDACASAEAEPAGISWRTARKALQGLP